MLHIGCHESTSQGYYGMGQEALDLDADTFAFFTRNPRGGQAKNIEQKDIDSFIELAKAHNFVQLVAHAPYTMNPCSADPALREYAKNIMLDDMKRMEFTPGNLYNFHPGSHVKQGADVGINFTAEMLAEVIQKTPDIHTTILIETMAGKGSEIGRTFEEVKAIIDRTEEILGTTTAPAAGQMRLGVCMDTCHVWDGGYDIVNNLNGVIEEFNSIIGLERLKAVHLNDSMNGLNTHKDRHAKIGEGKIGLDALVNVINHPLLKNLPFILETPNEHDGYKNEIKLLRQRSL